MRGGQLAGKWWMTWRASGDVAGVWWMTWLACGDVAGKWWMTWRASGDVSGKWWMTWRPHRQHLLEGLDGGVQRDAIVLAVALQHLRSGPGRYRSPTSTPTTRTTRKYVETSCLNDGVTRAGIL